MARPRRRPSNEPVERPAGLDRAIPFPPMEAELVRELPEGKEWQYEPKWDGFRGLLENASGDLRLWSRNARPLLRYFPELEPLAKLLPPRSALDGEIVIERKGVLDFDAMQMRLHPAESRVRKLAAEIPARFIAFDVLVWKGEQVWKEPLAKRRTKLGRVAKRFELSPATRDQAEALRVARAIRGHRPRRRRRQAARPAVSPRLTRRRREGQAGEDGGLRRRGRPLEREADAASPRCSSGCTTRTTCTTSARCAVAPVAARHDARAREAVAERRARARLLGAEPLGNGGELAESALRPELVVRGPVRQGREAPHPSRHAVPSLPPRQGSGATARGRRCARADVAATRRSTAC